MCSIPSCDELQNQLLEVRKDWPRWLQELRYPVYIHGDIVLCSPCFAIIKSRHLWPAMRDEMRQAYRELQATNSMESA